jgi:hypothetical protein
LPFSLMIWVCLLSISGVTKLLFKLSDNSCNKVVSIGSTKPKEVISRVLKTYLMLVLWIIQEEAEMIFQTDSRGNSSSSTWFYHFQFKAFMALLSNSSSD